ncbi:MAG: GNAT family N-acetyltransferase [Bacteroidota bacterium]
MITFRRAVSTDAEKIADLHVKSWREHYRGSMTDHYLEKVAPTERLGVWRNRFLRADPKRWILLAEIDDQLAGFICVEVAHDPVWGALLDNLHVNSDVQGQGLGKQLLIAGAHHVLEQEEPTGMYLWVLTDNQSAIGFYQRLGGRQEGPAVQYTLAGNVTEVYRYAWTVEALMALNG